MNVLKPDLQTTIKTLLSKGVSQREIERKTGIDRKTIRKYARIASQKTEHSKSPTDKRWPPGPWIPRLKIPHPGHRFRNKCCQDMLVRHVKSIGSG
jgi:hypothetical protein